jgi:hypothetical protein
MKTTILPFAILLGLFTSLRSNAADWTPTERERARTYFCEELGYASYTANAPDSAVWAANDAFAHKTQTDRHALMSEFGLSASEVDALREEIRSNVMNGTLPAAQHLTCSDKELKAGENEARQISQP